MIFLEITEKLQLLKYTYHITFITKVTKKMKKYVYGFHNIL